jgi:hypothetical protein
MIIKLKSFLYLSLYLPLIAGMGLLLFACSRGEPEILFGFMELIYYPGEQKPEERYTFFILPEDDDGIENLAELQLHHDREGLRWNISSDDWVSYEDGEGKTWIGSRSIAMADDETLPRGRYRVVLINKGGERAERNFTFDAPEDPLYPFPFFSIDEGMYRVDSRYPVHRLICYDQQGNIIETKLLSSLEGSLGELSIPNSGRSAALWAEDPEYHVSALTEAVSLR